MFDITRTFYQFKMIVAAAIFVLLGQKVGYGFPVMDAVPGITIFIVVCMLALIIRDLTPKIPLPAFAWAALIGLIITSPFMPTAPILNPLFNKIHFLGTTTPILAFAGISVGNRVNELKSISWKLIIVAFVVFIGTFFGSAVIAQIVLAIQGII
jgi:hypothetical protein